MPYLTEITYETTPYSLFVIHYSLFTIHYYLGADEDWCPPRTSNPFAAQ